MLGVVFLVIGLAAFALIPSVLVGVSAESRMVTLILLLCAGPFFLLAAFGRRMQHLNHVRQEHPRPFDAPD